MKKIKNKKFQFLIWTIFGFIFLGSFMLATTTVSDNGINITGNIYSNNYSGFGNVSLYTNALDSGNGGALFLGTTPLNFDYANYYPNSGDAANFSIFLDAGRELYIGHANSSEDINVNLGVPKYNQVWLTSSTKNLTTNVNTQFDMIQVDASGTYTIAGGVTDLGARVGVYVTQLPYYNGGNEFAGNLAKNYGVAIVHGTYQPANTGTINKSVGVIAFPMRGTNAPVNNSYEFYARGFSSYLSNIQTTESYWGFYQDQDVVPNLSIMNYMQGSLGLGVGGNNRTILNNSVLYVVGNSSFNGTVQIIPTTLPACTAATNHTLASNATGLYYCNSTQSWTLVAAG